MEGENWLEGWTYRKSHTLQGSAAGSTTNYSVQLTVHYGSGTDGDADVYLHEQCQPDFGDLRFTRSDGQTALDYWVEATEPGNTAVVWVEVDAIPVSPTTTGIYLYYGNDQAETASDGPSTFLYFENFETDHSDEWEIFGEGAFTWETAERRLRTTDSVSGAGYYYTQTTFPVGTATRARQQGTGVRGGATQESNPGLICAGSEGGMAFYRIDRHSYNDQILFKRREAGSGTTVDCATLPWDNAYHVYELRWPTVDHIYGYYDDMQLLSNTSPLGEEGYVGFQHYIDTGYYVYTDWILVRTYTDPEPSHGSWGEAEERISGTTTTSTTTTTMPPDQESTTLTMTITLVQTSTKLPNIAPTVEILQPTQAELIRGTYVIRWSAYDADGDTLTFTVRYKYATDPTWTLIASDLTEPFCSWDTTQVDVKHPRGYWIEVEASDGIDTTIAQSEQFFIKEEPSSVTTTIITTPTQGGNLGNLLSNSGFESGAFAPWVNSDYCDCNQIQSEIVYSGNYALQMDPILSSWPNYQWVIQSLEEPPSLAENLVLSAAIYPTKTGPTAGQAGVAWVEVRIEDTITGETTTISYEWSGYTYPNNDVGMNKTRAGYLLFDWTPYQWNNLNRELLDDYAAVFGMPPDPFKLKITDVALLAHISNGDPGKFYADNLALTPKPTTSQTNAMFVPSFRLIEALSAMTILVSLGKWKRKIID